MEFSNLNWKVKSFPLEVKGQDVRGLEQRQAIIRTDTKKLLSITSDQYKVLDNKHIIGALKPLVSYYENKKSYSMLGGKKCALRMFGGKKSEAEVSVGDAISSGMYIRWSHDRSSSIIFQPFLLRLVCENGMMSEQMLQKRLSIAHIHTNEKEVKKKVAEFIESILSEMEVSLKKHVKAFQAWQKVRVNERDADRTADKIFKLKTAFDEVSNTRQKNMKEAWKAIYTESSEDKSRLWGLYNTFTDFFSHRSGKKLGKPEERMARGKLTADLMNCFRFCDLLQREKVSVRGG